VQGGSSGIGVTAIQLAKAMGSEGDRHRRQRRQGGRLHGAGRRCRHQLPTQDFVAEVKAATGGQGADVVLDMVAGDYLARELQCLADDGRWSSSRCRAASIAPSMPARCCAAVSPSPAARCGRARWPSRVPSPRHCAAGLAAAGSRPHQAGHPPVFPAAQAAQSHALMESSQHVGKIVLDWTV
jgi:NADPH2:quinone reductase